MGAGTSPASSQKPVMPLFLYHSAGFKSEYRKQHLPYSEMSSQRWPLAKSWARLMKQEGSWVPGFRSSVASFVAHAEGDFERFRVDKIHPGG